MQQRVVLACRDGDLHGNVPRPQMTSATSATMVLTEDHRGRDPPAVTEYSTTTVQQPMRGVGAQRRVGTGRKAILR